MFTCIFFLENLRNIFSLVLNSIVICNFCLSWYILNNLLFFILDDSLLIWDVLNSWFSFNWLMLKWISNYHYHLLYNWCLLNNLLNNWCLLNDWLDYWNWLNNRLDIGWLNVLRLDIGLSNWWELGLIEWLIVDGWTNWVLLRWLGWGLLLWMLRLWVVGHFLNCFCKFKY